MTLKPPTPLWLLTVSSLCVLAPPIAGQAKPAASPPPRSLRLEQAVSRALRRSPQLATLVSDLRIAKAGVVEARGVEDFVLGSAASWSATRGQEAPGLALDDASASVSLTRPLPTGGTLGLRFGTEYTRVASLSGAGGATGTYRPAAVLSFTHPLLRGCGTRVARAARRRARSALDQAGLRREAAAADLVRAVVQTYWELAFAETRLRVRRSSLGLAREQLRAVRANIEVGKQPPSAAAEVEVAIALREDEAVQAELLVRERSLELQQLLGVEADAGAAPLGTRDPLEPRFTARGSKAIATAPGVRAAIERARQHNPELAAARAAVAAAAIEVDVTRNGLLPQLDFTVGAGPLGSDASPRAAFDELARAGGYAVQAGLTLSFPIERNEARGQHAAAREGLRKARLLAQAISVQVAAGVARAAHAVRLAEKRIRVLAHATDLAARDLAAEKARFEVGRSSSFELLRRQDELARARLQQARAKADSLEGEALLEALTGEILGRFAVELR